jgi:hypothetical protein
VTHPEICVKIELNKASSKKGKTQGKPNKGKDKKRDKKKRCIATTCTKNHQRSIKPLFQSNTLTQLTHKSKNKNKPTKQKRWKTDLNRLSASNHQHTQNNHGLKHKNVSTSFLWPFNSL